MTFNDENCAPVESESDRSRLSSSELSKSVSSDTSRASKVFGDLVGPEDSLTYSPSPLAEKKQNRGNAQNANSAVPQAFTFDDETSFYPAKKTDSGAFRDVREKVEVKKGSSATRKVGKLEHGRPGAASKRSAGKESPAKRRKGEQAKQCRSNNRSIRSRSPFRRDMVKQTQLAINRATASVNHSLVAPRMAKKERETEVRRDADRLREERRQDKLEAAAFHAEVEQMRRDVRQMRGHMTTRWAKAKANRERTEQQAKIKATTKEVDFKSKVFRDHQKALKDAEDRRRRMSTDVKSKIFKERKEATERLRLNQIEEERACMEERNLGSVASREFQQLEAEKRRVSFAFRNAEGKRQRDFQAENEADDLRREHESYELKWAGERDAEAYKKKMAEERRDSLAFRNAEGKQQRDLEAEMDADEQHREHESYELKWAGERDAEAYKKKMAEERRDSLAFRNAEGKQQRDLEAEMDADEQHREHESYELKWAGERDAEAYKKKMAEERRESFAFRNREGARHRAVMEELKALAKEKEHESYILKWAGENDAKSYLAEMQQERRDSFAFRNAEGKQHREMEEQERYKTIQESQQEEELQAACRRDVEKYKVDCAARDRVSLCFRREEAQIQRLEAENEKQRQYELDQESRALDAAAGEDVKKYLQSCKKRKRLSLAFRAKEKREHTEWERKQADAEREKRNRDTRDRAMDSKYAQLAIEKERARIALDNIRHADCNFAMNPFAAVLNDDTILGRPYWRR